MPVTGGLVRKPGAWISRGIVDLGKLYEGVAGMLLDAHQKSQKQNKSMKETDAPPGR
jgi:hypothetical protein